jgi:hypothetical protein
MTMRKVGCTGLGVLAFTKQVHLYSHRHNLKIMYMLGNKIGKYYTQGWENSYSLIKDSILCRHVYFEKYVYYYYYYYYHHH